MTENKKLFHQVFQRVKFWENDSDCFSKAQAKRQMMLLNLYGSIYLKENECLTEFVLNEALRDYANVVDNHESGNVNNYADFVLATLSNYQNDDKKNWKSDLDNFNIKNHITKLSCSNDINCINFTCHENLRDIKKAFVEKEPEEITNNIKNFFQSEMKLSGAQNPMSHLSFQKSKSFENSLCESATLKWEQHYVPLQKKKAIQTPQSKVEESEKPFGINTFRTARDELHIQNAKKLGKGGNGNDRNLNYGVVKKSLGTRKGGVFVKFQPPVKSKETKNEQENLLSTMEVDEVVDERLKNIDPAMIELIKNEIMDCGSKISWNDIAGLHLAKSTIQEIVVWPMLRPDIFTGLRRPPKGILLFGPPGTGKTLIGKCIASQSNSTFFSISASSLTSKWVGDGEKMVRTLFAVAKVHQPSVVFIDEIDSLLSQRSDSEHECSRRIKTEFLVQLDGAGTGDEDRILIIGATNRPQELDEAARRRLVKRLYIPLPDEEARKQIIQNLISTERHCLSEREIDAVAKMTKGYSGADVKNLCQEASLGPIRSIPPSMIQNINSNDVRPLDYKDFESALCRIKSSVSEKDLDTYVAWDKQYGCGSASNPQ